MKRILLLTLIAISLLLFGCGSQNTVPQSTDPYIGGTQGMSMEFVNGMPPDYIFDDSGYPFGVGIRLRNVGESDVEASAGYIEIIGINPEDFNKGSQDDLKQELPNSLNAAKKNFDGSVIEGGETIVEFSDMAYIPDLKGNTGVKVRANLCYDYTTMTTTKICVKKDLLSDKESDAEICQISGVKDTQNSGGPIHITGMSENPMGNDKIQVQFTVEHVGTHPGASFFKYTEDCDTSITNTDRFKVFIEATSDVNGQKPSCNGLEEASGDSSSGFITLFDGEPRTITCQIDTSGVNSVYEDLLTINLRYKYLQAIEKPLEIRDVSTS